MAHPSCAVGIAAAVASHELSVGSVVEETLGRIAADNTRINAFTAILAERARNRAKQLDTQLAGGQKAGPLAGVCFGVKNLFDIEGLPTLAGSRINRTSPPADRDAEAIRRLEAAGAVLVGAQNMGEYACDFTGENIHNGSSRNPRDVTRQTGGSSGGSAAAVAAGMVPFSLGTDTNGSVRVPASWCGVWGLKASFGRLSRSGVFPFASSLDHVGIFTRTADDLALVYRVLSGGSEARSSQQLPARSRIASIASVFPAISEEANVAVALVEEAMQATGQINIPDFQRANAAANILTMAEGGALHLSRLRERGDDFTPSVRRRLTAGAMLPSTVFLAAKSFQQEYSEQLSAILERFDVLIAPATPGVAPPLGSVGPGVNSITDTGYCTRPFSLAGVPVVTVPAPSSSLPIGVQLIAAHGKEDLLLAVSASLERTFYDERSVSCGKYFIV